MSDQIMQALDEMQARCVAATPRPWEAEGSQVRRIDSLVAAVRDHSVSERRPDAEFIAAARTDMPRLIAALKAVVEEHRKVLWHTEECSHWPDRDCDCIELENGDWYEPYIGYPVCETCSGDVSCHGSEDHAVEYPCPTVKAIAKALGVDDA